MYQLRDDFLFSLLGIADLVGAGFAEGLLPLDVVVETVEDELVFELMLLRHCVAFNGASVSAKLC